MRDIPLQEHDMRPADKSANTDKQKRRAGAGENGPRQKAVPGPQAEARARAAATKLHGPGKMMEKGRKVPFGPVGGLGRKTNLARSS
jgi:hypothetical protein